MAKKRERVVHRTGGQKMVQENMAGEADINTIVARHLKGHRGLQGISTNMVGSRRPKFGNYTGVDFQDMMNSVIDIENQFSQLPSRVRSRFRNQPLQVVRFVEDPANYDEALKLGLIPPRPRTVDEAYEAMMEAAAAQERAQQKADDLKKKAELLDNIRAAYKADPEANPWKKPEEPAAP